MSAEQDIQHSTLVIAGYHVRTKAKFITEVSTFDYERAALDFGYNLPCLRTRVGGEVTVIDTGTRIYDAEGRRSAYVTSIHPVSYRDFQPIDCEPQFRPYTEVFPQKLTDLVHFAPAVPRLIVPEDTVGDLLDRITKLQQPVRKEFILKQSIGII